MSGRAFQPDGSPWTRRIPRRTPRAGAGRKRCRPGLFSSTIQGIGRPIRFSGCFLKLWRFENTAARNRIFSRSGFDARFFAPLFPGHVFAFQAAAEISDGKVPVVRRLHIGGGRSLRGFLKRFLHGENAFQSSVEYRVPFCSRRTATPVSASATWPFFFADAGAAWYQNQALKWNSLRGSFGFGFHGILDRLVLRLEWGTRGKGAGFISTGNGGEVLTRRAGAGR